MIVYSVDGSALYQRRLTLVLTQQQQEGEITAAFVDEK